MARNNPPPFLVPSDSHGVPYRPHHRTFHWLCAATFAVTAVVSSAGCQSVARRLTVRSDPPGALVMIDGREIGYTPASVDFTYYATREITLVKDGYQTLTTLQAMPTPVYQYPGIDFISDNFLPVTVTNRHDVLYRMRTAVNPPTDELLNRADALRGQARIGQ